ncbi:MAG: YoaK family protein [Candidatus Dormibacteria bacterium]|jgi:uncharacterized membrane protein YoaK (UPF0700 family)|nr:DUF1275 domain-containing protein [Chloroflexota bacterium]HBV94768.1 DUF1275 domain-containing protein [Chloroflexota bacterium]
MSTLARSLLDDVRQTLFPRRGARHGLLPPLLVGMTVITGVVDAFSYLVLGHVFVANMTGNVVFLGFALAGVGGFSVVTSVVAVGAFVVGAAGGGLLRSHLGTRVGRHLAAATGIQLLLMAVALLLSAVVAGSVHGALRDGLVAILAAALGIQNATARGLAVPDLTTTVLTLTITGIAADARAAGGSGARAGRRLISVAAMLAGAVVGAVLILRGQVTAALAVAVILMAAIVASTRWVPRWAGT